VILGRLRLHRRANGPGHDPRREGDALIADKGITSLSAFRVAARAKTFPTPTTSQENPNFRR
jgi:hypothetical protein